MIDFTLHTETEARWIIDKMLKDKYNAAVVRNIMAMNK